MRTTGKVFALAWIALLYGHSGIAMRVDVSLMSDSFRLGEPVYCWIQFTNDSPDVAYMLSQGNALGIEVRNASGTVLRFHGPYGDRPPGSPFRKFGPGEVRVIRFDLEGAFDLTVPGAYRVNYGYPRETIDRLQQHYEPSVSPKLVVRDPQVSPPFTLAVVDANDEVSPMLAAWKIRKRHVGGPFFELAVDVLEQHPKSPYAPAARMMMVWRYFSGPESTRFSRAQQVEKASETLTELCRDRRNGYLCAPAAAYLIEKAISRDQPSIANSWIDFLKREFPNQPPAALARIKEREIGEGVRGGNDQ